LDLLLDEHLLKTFENLLVSPPPLGRQKEQVIQEFMEVNTELIPTPNLLNHHLHFEAVVSKFPLGTELTADYLYITKSSDIWRITLVELEAPEKKIFNDDKKKTNTSAEFNAALNQVRSWQIFIDDNRAEVLRRLEPLLRPLGMSRNPIEFRYQLVIGRSQDKNLSAARKKHFRKLINESGVDILTYDTLINWYRNNQRFKKNVLRLSGAQFEFKHMHIEPTQILSYLGPDHLAVSSEQRERLLKSGYEIDKWQKGDLLTFNVKFAESTCEQALKEGKLFDLN